MPPTSPAAAIADLLRAARFHPLLGAAEERRLLIRAGAGDREAERRLVLSHLRFVIRIARRYRNAGLPLADLVQEGVGGLLKAARRYDPAQGTRFSTYAAWWVRSAIQDHAIESWSLVRIGTTNAQRALFLHLRRLAGGAGELSDEIAAALARRFDTTVAEVRALARRVARADRASEVELAAVAAPDPGPEEMAERGQIKRLIEKGLALLSPRERLVIERRYLDEAKATFEAIGRELGLSKDRARQLEAKALATLRATLGPVVA
ncbi:MAG: sigma-70 family RNA polymerase sigma factor [Magnetospirillum sp. WYHS-4]